MKISVINRHVLFIFACLFGLCLCRRPGRPRPINGSGGMGIAVAFILVPNAFGLLSFVISQYLLKKPKVAAWQGTLTIPKFYPPGWLMMIIWLTLYTCMGWASYVIYRERDGFTPESALPFTLYGCQLLLNFTFSPIFFKFHSTRFAFFHFIALDIAASACTINFFLVANYTVYFMAPYLGFLAFLTISTYLVWKRSPMDITKEYKENL